MYGWDQGNWMFGSGTGGWMIFGGLMMILIWLIPVLGLFALVKYLFGGQKSGESAKETHRTALDILDETYAHGELSRDEYLQKRDDLQNK